MHPTLLHIGPLTLHTYGLLVAIGIFLAIGVMRGTLGRRGISGDRVDSLAVLLIITGFLGARVAYFAVEEFQPFKNDPLSFFRIWEGGLVFYGGVLGALAALWVYARRQQSGLIGWTDALAPALLLGHAIGRLGCFAAGCCYGRPTESFLGVTFTHPDSLAPLNVSLHPTQLYEAAGTFVLFLIALPFSKRWTRPGSLTAFYLLSYGTLRFLIELLRGDDRGEFISGLSPSQWVALFLGVSGAALVIKMMVSKDVSRRGVDPHIG